MMVASKPNLLYKNFRNARMLPLYEGKDRNTSCNQSARSEWLAGEDHMVMRANNEIFGACRHKTKFHRLIKETSNVKSTRTDEGSVPERGCNGMNGVNGGAIPVLRKQCNSRLWFDRLPNNNNQSDSYWMLFGLLPFLPSLPVHATASLKAHSPSRSNVVESHSYME